MAATTIRVWLWGAAGGAGGGSGSTPNARGGAGAVVNATITNIAAHETVCVWVASLLLPIRTFRLTHSFSSSLSLDLRERWLHATDVCRKHWWTWCIGW